jgi:hypothetical protein
MPRLLMMIVLVCLAAPPAALALRLAPGDGTLVVRDAVGVVRLDIEGAALGRLEGGQLELISPTVDDCRELDVWGADRTRPATRLRTTGQTSCLFTELIIGGTPQPIRFRLALASSETLILRGGTGLSLAVVGQGRGTIRGTTGTYSLNGQKFVSLPEDGLTVRLGATLQ